MRRVPSLSDSTSIDLGSMGDGYSAGYRSNPVSPNAPSSTQASPSFGRFATRPSPTLNGGSRSALPSNPHPVQTTALSATTAAPTNGRRARGAKKKIQLTDTSCNSIQFLSTRKCWVDSSKRGIATHLSLDACFTGMAKVESTDLDEFRKGLAADIVAGRRFYLNQIKTPTYCMFVDVDLKDNSPINDLWLMEFCSFLYRAARSFYPDRTEDDMIFDILPTTRHTDNSKGYYSDGLHIYMPNLVVNNERALWIHATLFFLCQQHMERKPVSNPSNPNAPPLPNPWESALDAGVYAKTGLRIYGSRKPKECPDCAARGRYDTACICHGAGQVDGDHRYNRVPFYLRGNHMMPEAMNDLCNPYLVLKLTSLRDFRNLTEKWLPPGTAPNPNSVPGAPRPSSSVARASVPALRTRAPAGWHVVHSSSIKQTILGLIHAFSDRYKDLTLQLVQQKIEQTCYKVYVVGFSERWCHNKMTLQEVPCNPVLHSSANSNPSSPSGHSHSASRGLTSSSSSIQGGGTRKAWVRGGFHTSNTIYFEITINGIYQRCWSKKPATAERWNGRACNDRTEDILCYPLRVEDQRILFPDLIHSDPDTGDCALGIYLRYGTPESNSSLRLQQLEGFLRFIERKGFPERFTDAAFRAEEQALETVAGQRFGDSTTSRQPRDQEVGRSNPGTHALDGLDGEDIADEEQEDLRRASPSVESAIPASLPKRRMSGSGEARIKNGPQVKRAKPNPPSTGVVSRRI